MVIFYVSFKPRPTSRKWTQTAKYNCRCPKIIIECNIVQYFIIMETSVNKTYILNLNTWNYLWYFIIIQNPYSGLIDRYIPSLIPFLSIPIITSIVPHLLVSQNYVLNTKNTCNVSSGLTHKESRNIPFIFNALLFSSRSKEKYDWHNVSIERQRGTSKGKLIPAFMDPIISPLCV